MLALSWQLVVTMMTRLVCLRTQVCWYLTLSARVYGPWSCSLFGELFASRTPFPIGCASPTDFVSLTTSLLTVTRSTSRPSSTEVTSQPSHISVCDVMARSSVSSVPPRTGRNLSWVLVTHLVEHDLVTVRREPLNHHSIKILTKIF